MAYGAYQSGFQSAFGGTQTNTLQGGMNTNNMASELCYSESEGFNASGINPSGFDSQMNQSKKAVALDFFDDGQIKFKDEGEKPKALEDAFKRADPVLQRLYSFVWLL